MDSLIAGAARSLAAGDPLGALQQVALRDDAPALALRGIAMAQLGELTRAKVLLRKAARTFGTKAPVARARCVVAEMEVALASRDLGWPTQTLNLARATLEAHGDWVNAAHARYLAARHLLLIGRIDDADTALTRLDPARLAPPSKVAYALVLAGIAIRRIQTQAARTALARAKRIANQIRIPSLSAEVDNAMRILDSPAARLISMGKERLLMLADVEALFASSAFIVDACRLAVRNHKHTVSLVKRPLLFTLVRLLCENWPDDVPRDVLITAAFRTKYADESHRVRLRVEIGRLRKALTSLADIRASKQGFVLVPHLASEVVVLAQPVDEQYAALLALLADGELWSSSALALALDTSQRTVQRALDTLAARGKVQPIGSGRARRWMTPPIPGFTTTLLLPSPLPSD